MNVNMQHARFPSMRTLSFARPYLLPVSSKSNHKPVQHTCRTSSFSRAPLNFRKSGSLVYQPVHYSVASTSTGTGRRHASATTTTSSPSRQTKSTSPETTLTWNDFLRLRRIRRYYNLGASIGTSLTTLVTGMATLSQQNLSALGQQLFGLDPFVLLGLCATGFAGIGWLLGPIVGTGVFQLLYRNRARGMAVKEKNFFQRIRKYRVDPSSSSMQNPPPDYYGEKITSVAGYRRWLKDQRAFNKKRQSFV